MKTTMQMDSIRRTVSSLSGGLVGGGGSGGVPSTIPSSGLIASTTTARVGGGSFSAANLAGFSSSSVTTTEVAAFKLSVIVELGTRFFKVGFERDARPRAIYRAPSEWTNASDLDDVELRKLARRIFRDIYFRKLAQTSTEVRRIVLVESVFTPTRVRETLCRTLFDDFSVPAILFIPAPIASAQVFCAQTALVLETGYLESGVYSILTGELQLAQSAQSATCTAKTLHNRVRELVQKHSKVQFEDGTVRPLNTDDLALFDKLNYAEEIASVHCFVVPIGDAPGVRAGNPARLPPDSLLPFGEDGRRLQIPGIVRISAAEALFEEGPDESCERSLAQMILDVVAKMPIDARRALMNAWLPTGGLFQLPGFQPRLRDEVRALAERRSTSAVAWTKQLGVLRFDRWRGEHYTAWLGGSMLAAAVPTASVATTGSSSSSSAAAIVTSTAAQASSALRSEFITRDVWRRRGHVSDWCFLGPAVGSPA